MTASLPDAFRFGYTRKELAIASAFMADGCPEDIKPHFANGADKAIAMPSFIATINGGAGATQPTATNLTVNQTFATGSAARLIANDNDVRKSVRSGIAAATTLSTATTAREAATASQAAAAAREAAATANRTALDAEAQARTRAKQLGIVPSR